MSQPSLPRFPDLNSGIAYLTHVPLANPILALPALRLFYESLIRDPLPPKPFLQLLEQARLPLATVLQAFSERYQGLGLPLADVEESAFHDTVGAWELAASAYARCAQHDPGSDAGHADRISLILHRCIDYIGLAIHEHYLARRELSEGMWLDLFGYFASAEEWEIATRPVADPLEPAHGSTHCAAALITALLTDLAGPYSFTVREIQLIRQWANLWSPLVAIHHASLVDSLPEYSFDLTQDGGLRYCQDEAPNNDHRRLDTSRLAIQIAQVQVQLNQRVPPSQIGLGPEVSSAECRRLLELLARPWTQAASPRRFRRRASSGNAEVATGFEAIHYFVSGSEFRQPNSQRQYSRKEFETLFAFRHMVDPSQPLEIQKNVLQFPRDSWHVLNQSANGFRLERSSAGQKLAHAQLIGLIPPDGDRMILAQTHWLMQDRSGGLIAGVGVLPGTPQAIAVRAYGINVSPDEAFSRAFMLPAIAAMKSEAALVLPHGWFRPGRVVEIFTETAWRAKLTAMASAGTDFDLVRYELSG